MRWEVSVIRSKTVLLLELPRIEENSQEYTHWLINTQRILLPVKIQILAWSDLDFSVGSQARDYDNKIFSTRPVGAVHLAWRDSYVLLMTSSNNNDHRALQPIKTLGACSFLWVVFGTFQEFGHPVLERFWPVFLLLAFRFFLSFSLLWFIFSFGPGYGQGSRWVRGPRARKN